MDRYTIYLLSFWAHDVCYIMMVSFMNDCILSHIDFAAVYDVNLLISIYV